ncbi:MAG: chemotaxis protein CheD [Pontiellaceae bacterium]|nr:chemotaxis protein CheD [Pontiellaceae bacterium]MBN2785911.1 chemotaxis protein CheD [Pontiellaceae bacterium]
MDIIHHHLHPSALFASPHPHHVRTVLGSCVAVCLWDPTLRMGGINHYMLPFWNGAGLATPRYGNIATLRLIEALEEHGATRSRLQAKVFGGAGVLGDGQKDHVTRVGARNIEVAETVLKEHRIPIVARCVGGDRGFKLIYKTYSGEVLLKRLNPIGKQN